MDTREPSGTQEGLGKIPIGELLGYLKSSPALIIPDEQLRGLGFRNTDPSFNIFANLGCIDIVPPDEESRFRIGIYASSSSDYEAYEEFERYGIVQLRRIQKIVHGLLY